MKCEEQMKMAWVNGWYVKMAIQSSVLICGLADKKVIKEMPSYPSMPLSQKEIDSEEHKEAQQTLLIAKMNKWQKFNNSKKK